MVNYYAILDAFPQMSQQDLLESYSNIVSCVGQVYGRHRVDEALRHRWHWPGRHSVTLTVGDNIIGSSVWATHLSQKSITMAK
ncbi:MAG: hypothetical protein Q9180_008454 [Flavoplaca navasiana]